MSEATYFVQFREQDGEPSLRWHTIACVHDRELADEIAQLAESAYFRVTVDPHHVGRAISRSALRREGALQHAEWELGMGRHREYGDGLRARAELNLRRRAAEPAPSAAP